MRLGPLARTRTGSCVSAVLKISDFSICSIVQPIALAASCAVRVPSGKVIITHSSPFCLSASTTRWVLCGSVVIRLLSVVCFIHSCLEFCQRNPFLRHIIVVVFHYVNGIVAGENLKNEEASFMLGP